MKPNRRTFVQTLGIGALGAAMPPVAAAAQQAKAAPTAAPAAAANAPILKVGDKIAVADTTYGKVRGYILRGVHYFLGMPYGADTSGANRFMPPQKPKPWTDVFPALWWGHSRRRRTWRTGTRSKYGAFRDHWNYDDVSEDCLRINVFTPALKDGKKRPVMFWIHGGGFTAATASSTTATTARTSRGSATWCSARSTTGSGRSDSAIWRASAARSSPRRATSACSTSWPRSSGSATTSPTSAATRAT